jgi:sporulation protein YlmC with PRC-barrel domain
MEAVLSELIGLPVVDHDGAPLGRLRDLAVSLTHAGPVVTSVRVGSRRGVRTFAWSDGGEVDASGVRLAPGSRVVRERPDDVLLVRDVLDRQIFATTGRHVTRVGDLALALNGAIRVVGVEAGAAPLLRRLGLRRLARRARGSLIAWEDLHLLSGPGHALQLASPGAVVHRLDEHALAELVHRAPHPHAATLLSALPPERAGRIAALAGRLRRRRRSSDPLSARTRAPS